MNVAVVTSTPLFVEGGHLVMARALVQARYDWAAHVGPVLSVYSEIARQPPRIVDKNG